MNSQEFFKNQYQEWTSRQGIYVIEQPVISDKLNRKIYKVGYANGNLATRLGDYRTAYSPFVPFLIHLLYEIPEATGGQRANFALLTEQIAHATLKNLKPESAWSGGGEWFYDLDKIINVIASIRQKHLREVPQSKNWTYFSAYLSDETVEVEDEENISSSMAGLVTITDEERERRFNRGQATPDYSGERVMTRNRNESVRRETVPVTPRRRPPADASLKDKEGNYLIHDGTKADDYIGRTVEQYFRIKGKTKLFTGEVLDYTVNDKNKKYKIKFRVYYPEDNTFTEERSDKLLRLLVN